MNLPAPGLLDLATLRPISPVARQTPMPIEIDGLSRPALHDLLNEHLQNMRALSPPESVHALDLVRLRQPDISF